jgi:hypothetical protein
MSDRPEQEAGAAEETGGHRSRSQRIDHVPRRSNLRVPAPKINERLPVERSVLCNAREERSEVLLRKPFDAVGGRPHRAIVFSRACPAGRATRPAGR